MSPPAYTAVWRHTAIQFGCTVVVERVVVVVVIFARELMLAQELPPKTNPTPPVAWLQLSRNQIGDFTCEQNKRH